MLNDQSEILAQRQALLEERLRRQEQLGSSLAKEASERGDAELVQAAAD